jgi:hypothetical protein
MYPSTVFRPPLEPYRQARSRIRDETRARAVASDLEVYLPAIDERPNPDIAREAIIIMMTQVVAMHGLRVAENDLDGGQGSPGFLAYIKSR